jgi:hypothetical protein
VHEPDLQRRTVGLDERAGDLVGSLSDPVAVAVDEAVTGALVAVVDRQAARRELLVALAELAVADVAGGCFGGRGSDRHVHVDGA